MSWAVVARKDLLDARRSRSLWFLTGLFVVFLAGMAYVVTLVPSGPAGDETTLLGLVVMLSAPASLFVAITAVVIGYKAVAGETESGSGKLLLSFPHTRGNVVVGKFVGRSLVLSGAVVVGFLVALAPILLLYAEFSLVQYAVLVALTLLFVLAYTALVVGISATAKTTGRAAAMAVGAFFAMEVLWDVVPLGAAFVANGFEFTTTLPDWAVFLSLVVPSGAYGNAVSMFASGTNMFGASDVPFYLEGWASLVVLALWIVVPLVIGYLRYDAADL